MSGEMSPGELGRHIELLRGEIQRGFNDLRNDMGKYVLDEVHKAQMAATHQRIADLEIDLAAERAARSAQSQSHATWLRWALALAASSVIGVLTLLAGLTLTP